jgi:hypothetical protein
MQALLDRVGKAAHAVAAAATGARSQPSEASACRALPTRACTEIADLLGRCLQWLHTCRSERRTRSATQGAPISPRVTAYAHIPLRGHAGLAASRGHWTRRVTAIKGGVKVGTNATNVRQVKDFAAKMGRQTSAALAAAGRSHGRFARRHDRRADRSRTAAAREPRRRTPLDRQGGSCPRAPARLAATHFAREPQLARPASRRVPRKQSRQSRSSGLRTPQTPPSDPDASCHERR